MRSSNPVLTRSNRGFAQMGTTRLDNDSLETTYAAPAASSLRTGRAPSASAVGLKQTPGC